MNRPHSPAKKPLRCQLTPANDIQLEKDEHRVQYSYFGNLEIFFLYANQQMQQSAISAAQWPRLSLDVKCLLSENKHLLCVSAATQWNGMETVTTSYTVMF